jgi:hypothetical protein
MKAAFCYWLLGILAASRLMASDPFAARFDELRRRIATGGDVSELIRQWGPKSLPPARGTGSRSAGMSASLTKMISSGMLDPTRDRVRAAACKVGVHPSLALAILEHETGFNNSARGEKGEIGVGQIMPTTADLFGYDRNKLAADFDYSVDASVGIMRYLLDYFGGDEDAAIRGYNGGPGWRKAGPSARGMVETYAASVSRLRSKYVPVTCG